MLEKLPEALGAALSDVRAGLTHTVFHAVDLGPQMGSLQLLSLAFADHAPMPMRYTADGPGLSPPLHWHGLPAAATEWVLIVEDADSPTPQPVVHAIAHGPTQPWGADDGTGTGTGAGTGAGVDATPGAGALPEGALSGPAAGDSSPEGDDPPQLAMGRNSLLQTRWLPPDPPPAHGVHRYVFQLFALGPGAAWSAAPGREALRQALLERGLASGCLIGTYQRPSGAIAVPLAASGAVAAA